MKASRRCQGAGSNSDWLLLGDADNFGESVLGIVCLVEAPRRTSCSDTWAQPMHLAGYRTGHPSHAVGIAVGVTTADA